MKREQCTFLQESVEDFSQTSFSDTRQLSLLNGMPMPAKSSEKGQQKDGSRGCKCGKEMSDCLIHPSTRDRWIASMQDSLARTLVSLESKQAYLREPDQVFTEKFCVSLAWYDQSNSSWRTYQQSFLTDSELFSETWPRWGMTRAGSAYAHPMSERRITETDGSFWPTARTKGILGGSGNREQMQRLVMDGVLSELEAVQMMGVKLWPTPTAHNAKETNAPSESGRNTPTLAAQVGGKLNPDWVSWLMGFPIGFAKLKGK